MSDNRRTDDSPHGLRPRRRKGGYRIGEGAVSDPELRILAIGDSFLQAVEVEYEDTMPARIEQRLTTELARRVRVYNGGVSGWSPNHYLARLRHLVAHERYDFLPVFLSMGNDLVDAAQTELQARAPTDRAVLRLPKELTIDELVQSLLVPVNEYLEQRSHLFVLVKNASLLLRVRLRLATVALPLRRMHRSLTDGPWRVTSGICEEIASTARRADMDTLFVILPSEVSVDPARVDRYARLLGRDPEPYDPDLPQTRMTRVVARRSLRFVDTTPALREAHARGGALYDRVTVHLSPRGHEVVANAVAPLLQKFLQAGPGPGGDVGSEVH